MAGRTTGPTEAEVRQFLEDGIEAAVKREVGERHLRNENIFDAPTGDDEHIALGYAENIRTDPECPVLHYEEDIDGKTPKGPIRWHGANDLATTMGQ